MCYPAYIALILYNLCTRQIQYIFAFVGIRPRKLTGLYQHSSAAKAAFLFALLALRSAPFQSPCLSTEHLEIPDPSHLTPYVPLFCLFYKKYIYIYIGVYISAVLFVHPEIKIIFREVCFFVRPAELRNKIL